MAQTVSTVAPAVVSLDAERLDVYRLAVAFHCFAAPLLELRGVGSLRDQLDRASASVVLNIAEGAGRRTAAEKASFYTIARGSATECAAILDLLLARAVIASDAHRAGRDTLVRIVQMLTRLVARPVRS
jgi:four helix bundle protein